MFIGILGVIRIAFIANQIRVLIGWNLAFVLAFIFIIFLPIRFCPYAS